MHLTKVEIVNFRSLKNVTVDLQPGLNVVVGRNNSGKTNLLGAIRAAPAELDRILRTLRVQMEEMPIDDLSANGLGYNNLLYIAVVLEHLKAPVGTECPLLFCASGRLRTLLPI